MESKRIEWIDALKGLTVIFVLIGHVPEIPDWLFKWIYGFHMPMFFIISGYLYNSTKWECLGFKKFVSSRAKSLLLHFACLSILLFILEILKLLIFSNVIYWEEFSKYIFDYIKWILFQINGDFCGSIIAGLWFLPTLFFSSIICFFLANKNKVINIIYFIIAMTLIKIQCHYSYTTIPWHLDVSLLGAIYMIVGFNINKYNLLNRISNSLIIILIFIASNICIMINDGVDLNKRTYHNYWLMLAGAILFAFSLLWVFNKTKVHSKTLITFGKYSIIVVACNFAVNNILIKLFQVVNVDYNWIVFSIIEILCFYIFLSIFNKILHRYDKLSILLGRRY